MKCTYLPGRLAGSSRLLFTLITLTGLATAQFTPISGSLSGTLTAGVYHATGNLSVAANQTLTLAPGVIIKLVGTLTVTVDGTLVANGTAANPVIFTDDDDDSAGGNTNGGGISTGQAGAWYGIFFNGGSSASVLGYTEIRYAGAGYYPGARVIAADPTLDHCTIRNCFSNGLELQNGARPTVTDCAFDGNGNIAVTGVSIQAVPGFANNTASGSPRSYLNITSADVQSAIAIGPQSMINGAVVLESNLNVLAGGTLTLQAGLNLKFRGARLCTINGTLLAGGTAANPVIFTDDDDDSAGGDTNGGGTSTGQAGAWYGIFFNAGSNASTLGYTEIRYAGAGYYPGARVSGADPTLDHCTIRNCFSNGLELQNGARPTVTDCAFDGNGNIAVTGVSIQAVPGFADNTASGSPRSYLNITTADVQSAIAIGPQSMINGAVVLESNLNVLAGGTLTLQAGLNLKFRGARLCTIDGTLLANGSAANPVIFTDDNDDSAGGDTNGGGLSSGQSGAWYGLLFNAGSDASVLGYTEIRYAGASYYPGARVTATNPAFNQCTIRNCYSNGLELASAALPTVTDCAFDDNGNAAVEGVSVAAIPGFSYNTATGNAKSYLRVTDGTVATTVRLGSQSMINGALVFASNLNVAATGALDVLQGVNFKFEGARTVTFDGPTRLRGTAYEPIVFTALADDSVGGDTNSNGPSTGSQGAWYGITFPPTAPVCRAENVIARFAGASYAPALRCQSANVTLRAVRTDRAYNHGFELEAVAPNPTNLVAWSCGGYGIHLVSGAFDLLHATSAGSSNGIRREAAWTGYVINSNCHGNTTDLQGLTAGQVLKSNGGFSGQNGNIAADPLFVDLANGDLHLQAGSPCLGAADYTFALQVGKDFDENSRVLDYALAGLALPDMGAYELGNWHMNVTGTPRPGSTVYLTVHGPAGTSFLGFGLLDGSALFQPYGLLLAGSASGVALVFPFTIPVGTPIPLTVPNSPGLVGTIIGLQTLTLQAANYARGNFTELYRALVRP